MKKKKKRKEDEIRMRGDYVTMTSVRVVNFLPLLSVVHGFAQLLNIYKKSAHVIPKVKKVRAYVRSFFVEKTNFLGKRYSTAVGHQNIGLFTYSKLSLRNLKQPRLFFQRMWISVLSVPHIKDIQWSSAIFIVGTAHPCRSISRWARKHSRHYPIISQSSSHVSLLWLKMYNSSQSDQCCFGKVANMIKNRSSIKMVGTNSFYWFCGDARNELDTLSSANWILYFIINADIYR